MNTTRTPPSHDDWQGMLGLVSNEDCKKELQIIKELREFGYISICRSPGLLDNHIVNINARLQDCKYSWRVMEDDGELYMEHINDLNTSTTS